jgi:hypothetical protein
VRQGDALPTLVRFRADETNDFGLAPWAEHEVEFWYGSWTRLPSGLVLARQRDVRRVGKPYKRMTVLTATLNAEAPADSFAISDSVTAAYLATEKRPMWQTTLDGVARIEREAFASFPPLTGTLGAVRIGGRWVVLEAAQSVGAMALVADWLGRNGGGAPIGGTIASNVFTGNGGAPWFATRNLPVYAAPGAAGTLATILGSRSGFTTISTPRWVRIGTDSLWVEPISVPDMQGTLALYSPTLRWAWAPFIGSPVHGPEQAQFFARLESRGLRVELIGGGRMLVGPKT